MSSLASVTADPNPFFAQLFAYLNEDGIAIDHYELDHLCYRVESLERYFALKTQCLEIGDLLTESTINGRPISVFKLHIPVSFKNRSISLLELPAPKNGSFYPEGFEHVEFVIDESLASFTERYSHLPFDKKGMGKKINPDVRLGYGPLSVKFHLYNLEYVIRYLD